MSRIEDFIPFYPKITDPEFTYNISKKKEFNELYLEGTELVPSVQGELLQHQLFIQRMYSPYTKYKRCLIAHRPGTGKTCTAIAVVENYKYNIVSNKPRKPALLFVKSEEIGRYIAQDISNVCTSGVYVPKLKMSELKTSKIMSEETRIARLNREISKMYQVVTYETYLPKLPENESDLKRMVEDRDIIFDELHTIRPQPKRKGKKGNLELEDEEIAKESDSLYTQIERMLKYANGHVFGLTGTPMWDQARDIAPIMNLFITEPELKLPTGKKFDDEYFDKDGDLKSDKIQELKEIFKGRVSYLREMVSSAKRIEMGITSPFTKHSKIYLDGMSDLQAEYAIKASEELVVDLVKVEGKEVERQTVGGTIYKLARDAMNMVFPVINPSTKEADEIVYGSEAFQKYIVKKVQIPKKGRTQEKSTINTYEIQGHLLKNELTNNLALYSTKFASIIEDIKAHPNELIFIYNEEVTGFGGAIMQGLCMQLQGFQWVKSAVDIEKSSKTKRFAIITSDPQTTNNPKQIQELLNSMNRSDNKYGDRLQIIIGSQKISLGLTFKNIRRIHLVTPHWNEQAPDQATARGIRFGSHDDLPPEERVVHIFKHAAVQTSESGVGKGTGYPKTASFSVDPPTIDIYIYRMAEEKDYKIAQVKRLLKESATDCAAFYSRNVLDTDIDGTRDCDYQTCNYECDTFPPSSKGKKIWSYKIPQKDLDYSTYNLLYSSDKIIDLTIRIVHLFRSYFSLSIDVLQTLLDVSNNDKGLLLKTIDTIIESRIVFRDLYGFKCYLKEEGGIIFLVDDLSGEAKYSENTYVETPLVSQISSFNSLVQILEYRGDENILKGVCKGDMKQFNMLSLKTKILLLEASYAYLNSGREKKRNGTKRAEAVINNMKNALYTMSDGSVVHVLYSTEYKGTSYNVAAKDIKTGGMRRYYEERWADVSGEKEDEYIKEIKSTMKEKKDVKFEQNPYGVVGWISKVDQKFRIIVQTGKNTRGRVCSSIHREDIIEIFIERIRYFPHHQNNYKGISDNKISLMIKGINGMETLKQKAEELSPDQRRSLLYMMSIKIDELCGLLQDWLKENDLLYDVE